MVRWFVFGVCFAAGAGAAIVMAGDKPGSFVKYSAVDSSPVNATTLVTHTVVAPAATVDRGLAQQPVHPYLMEVQQPGGAAVRVDPARNYNGTPIHKLDENHWILKAQRLHNSTTATTVETIGPSEKEAPVALGKIEPRAILMKPGALPKPDNGDGNIPAVPEQPEKAKSSTKKVVSAQ